jgi:glycosyltransferase involved in cell wall biosynthesis
MSRFPKLTETFILNEMIAVERQGVAIELFPLLRERQRRVHPEARAFVERARYLPFLSRDIVASQLWYLRHAPRRYLRALAAMLRGTWRSPNFLLGGIGIFPKVAHAARLMRRLGVTHVHCHFANHPALAGFLIRRLADVPYSFTAHGSDLHVDRRMLCTKIAAASFVVTVSHSNRAVIEAECGTVEGLRVLRCGVDTRLFSPGDPASPEPAAPGNPPTALRLICIGTLHEVKGQTHLIDAVGRLRDGGVAVWLTFVGDGPDRAALEAQVSRLGLAGCVEFAGELTRDDVAALLRTSDVLVAPSVPTREGKREGLPVVIPEAMSAGVAVVASHLSGIPELVVDDETGLTTPPGDAGAIAAAIRRLADDPALRRRLVAAARERVVQDFDGDRNAAVLAGWFRAGRAA